MHYVSTKGVIIIYYPFINTNSRHQLISSIQYTEAKIKKPNIIILIKRARNNGGYIL